MSDIDQIINGLEIFSELARHRDMVHEARHRARRVCGSCQHWMKRRECPRESNHNGWSRGPSCNEQPCSQFASTQEHLRDIAAYEAALAAPLPLPGQGLSGEMRWKKDA